MFKVGLTGGIGSGKTLVCSVLEKLGAAVYNADREAKRVMNEDPELKMHISTLFGNQAYGGGVLNREYLASLVFKDPEMLDKLNDLVHPAVGQDFIEWVKKQSHLPYVVKEAAILFESGSDQGMDLTVLVYAGTELRLNRVMLRDGMSREEVLNRMDKQMSEEEKKKRADYIVYNDGSQMLLPQIIELHNMILKRS